MRRSSLLLLGGSGLFAILLFGEPSDGPVYGQTKAPAKEYDGLLPKEGQDKLKSSFGNKAGQFRKLNSGEEQPKEASQKEVIDLAAQYYAYRLTWFDEHSKMAAWVKEVEQIFEHADRKAKEQPTQPFVQLFGMKLAGYLKEVLANKYPIARVNAAHLLARVAMETGQEDLADIFVDMLKDENQNEAVKYHALKGIKELFDKLYESKSVMKDQERLARTVQAVLDVLGRKLDLNAATLERIEGARVLRRIAVSALAAIRIPALVDKEKMIIKDKDGKPQGPTAWALLRVMRNDRLELTPRVDEQVEAAVGLARVPSKISPEGYQPDYAAHQIGQFVVEFAELYQKRTEVGKEREKERPWKVYAAKLYDALDALKQDAPKNKYIAEVVDNCKLVLNPIEKGNNANSGPLGSWLDKNQPKSETLYKDVKDSMIKPAEPPSEK